MYGFNHCLFSNPAQQFHYVRAAQILLPIYLHRGSNFKSGYLLQLVSTTKRLKVVNESRLVYYFLHYLDCRSTMSELFMECVEEELEPWQKQVPQVNLIDDDDDDDDEPIFVGVLCKSTFYKIC